MRDSKMGRSSGASNITRDIDTVDLTAVAKLVVEVHRAAPCAAVGAAVRVGSGWRFGWGCAAARAAASGHPAMGVATSTLFDLASLTKPVTALLLARAERHGYLNRGELCELVLGDRVEGVAATATGLVPLDLLASHRAGLEAHVELFVAERAARQPSKSQALLRAAGARRPECVGPPPRDGFPPVYSDLGYMLVGEALAARTGVPLDDLVYREISRPLGLSIGSARRLRRTEPRFDARVAPTERVPWRGGVLHGVVHDENAWVLEGEGTAGHAGLFGDVWSVVRLGVAVVEALAGRCDAWLRPSDMEPLVRRRPGGTHCAGFDRRGPDSPASGAHFGPETFGHLGFTGTSLWIDPDVPLVGVLLSNRVHPSRDNLAIRQARPAAYDQIWQRMMALG